jgi:hypothetical protein
MTQAFQLNAFQPNAFQTLTVEGILNATDGNDTGAFVGTVTGGKILIDTHDGGKRRKAEEAERKKFAAKQKAKRNEIIALFEQIIEGKPQIAEEIAEPFVLVEATIQAPAVIDYDAMLADLARVEQIYHAYIEMDDEEVLALL